MSSVIFCKQMNDETMKNVREEVRSSFTKTEIILMNDFEDFFSEVEIQNAYEEDWERDKNFYKPFYEIVYNDILKGK